MNIATDYLKANGWSRSRACDAARKNLLPKMAELVCAWVNLNQWSTH